MKLDLLWALLCVSTATTSSTFAQQPRQRVHESVTVPFVGCRLQGQLEEMEAPAGKPVPVAISASAAVKLAYYRDTGKFGVLAPRGWYCLGVLGSGTEEMFVSPEPIDPARISSGPGIEMKLSFGPVGRLDAAAMIARAFPSYWWFADEVVAGDEHLAASFIFGPYPKDKVIRHGETVVEFETPPRTEGLGAMSMLKANETPIEGVAMVLNKVPEVLTLCVRFSRDQVDLARVAVRQFERDVANSPKVRNGIDHL